MVTITVTPKTTTDVAVDVMASDFSTTSTSFVDVTDSSISVPNGYSYAARLDAANINASAPVQLLEGSNVKFNSSTVARTLFYSGLFVNNTGSAATVKWQIRTTNAAATSTAYATNGSVPTTIIAYAPYGINSPISGAIEIPTKINLDTLKFLAVYNGSVSAMGGTSVGSSDYAFTTVNIDNIVSGLIFVSAANSVTLYDWTGARIEAS